MDTETGIETPTEQGYYVTINPPLLNASDSTDGGSTIGHTPLKVPIYLQAILITMYSAIIILSVGGNLTVCFIVFRARRMRTVMNFFIVSLAMSDLLMAILCIPFTFVANLVLNYWPFGDLLCPIVTFLQSVTVFLSSFTLVAISMDRYIAIIYPLRQKMSKKQAFIVIALIWCVAFLIPIPTALFSWTHKYVNVSTAPKFCQEMFANPEDKRLYGTMIMLLQYFIPLLILMFTYGRISTVMWIDRTPGEAMTTRDQRMTESKRKIIKMMITVVIIYAICWLPLHALNIAGDVDPSIYDIKGMNYIWMTSHWLAMSNCMYNPFIYCWMNAKFRNGFLKVLNCFTCGLVSVNDEIEMQRMRRQDTLTVTTSVSVNGSLRRFNSSKRKEAATYNTDYTAIVEKR
ncbi:RYamide receptor-like [Ylistrum balloti]|uniref:RYamide receptor-like n=1 Tax=Ylistrum balloti TaxID=509963 RepID=UPI002905BAAB|nr:RYamide receptor-like [Ylistrum balloti]